MLEVQCVSLLGLLGEGFCSERFQCVLQLGLPEDCGAEGEREGWGEAAAAAAAGAETADAREWWWWRGTEPWMMDVYLVRELYLPVCGRP